MLEAIEKFEDLLRRAKKLNYGDHNLFQAYKKEAVMLVDNYLTASSIYKTDLEHVNTNKSDETQENTNLDNWIEAQDELINIMHIVIEDLKIQQKKKIQDSENKTEIEQYQDEIDRIKNETGKDLIFERNNYNYLKRKYDLLQYNYEQLKLSHQETFGKRNHWILYIIWAILSSLIILVFDQIISWDWFDNHPRSLYLKLSGICFAVTSLLVLPFRKDLRITIVSGVILIILLLLALLPY